MKAYCMILALVASPAAFADSGTPPVNAAVAQAQPFSHRFWEVAQQSWQTQTKTPARPLGERFNFQNAWDQRVALVHIEQWIERERQAGRNVPAADLRSFAPDVIQLLRATTDQHLREQAARILGVMGVNTPAVRDALIAAATGDLPIPPAILARGIDEEIEAWGRDGQGTRDQAMRTVARLFPRDSVVLTTLVGRLSATTPGGTEYTLDTYAAAEALGGMDLSILGAMPRAARTQAVTAINAWRNAEMSLMPVHPDDRDSENELNGPEERRNEGLRPLQRAVGQPGAARFFAVAAPGGNAPVLNRDEEGQQAWLQEQLRPFAD